LTGCVAWRFDPLSSSLIPGTDWHGARLGPSLAAAWSKSRALSTSSGRPPSRATAFAGLRAGWFNLHKSAGLTIAAVGLVRLAWRFTHRVAVPGFLPRWQQRAAQANHALLYVLMLLVPLTGYLGSAFSGYPVRYFGLALPAWASAWASSPRSAMRSAPIAST